MKILPTYCDLTYSYCGKSFFSIVFTCCILSLSTLAEPQIGFMLPETSVATSDGALASFFNPAGLGHNHTIDFYYLRTMNSRPNQYSRSAYFLGLHNLGLAVEGMGKGHQLTIATSSLLRSGISIGTSYSWTRTDGKNQDRVWSLGMLYRRHFFSAGLVLRDLNRRPQATHFIRRNQFASQFSNNYGRAVDVGIAIRPSTSRMTLSCDWRGVGNVFTDGYKLTDHLFLGVELRPIDTLILKAGRTINNYEIQFQLNFAQFGIGGYRSILTGKKSEPNNIGFINITHAHKTKPVRRSFYLDLNANEIETVLESSNQDPRVKGAIIRFEPTGLGLAKVQELRQKIANFRQRGKKVYAYLEGQCSTGDYLLASACNEILVHPSSLINLVGIRFEVSFYHDFLEQFGIEIEAISVGQYKNAPDSFTKTEMTESHRESLTNVLDDLYSQMTQGIAQDRGQSIQQVKLMIDDGPYTARRAVRNRVADRIVTRQQLENVFDGKRLTDYTALDRLEYNWQTPKPKIVVIEAIGNMVTGKSVNSFFGPSIMGADTIAQSIQSATDDDAVKAVVLRVDSGGGMVLAADIIWQALVRLKKVKPLIVSMASTAASGGYYIAAPADRIFANPATITGSIGVFGMKPVIKDLYQKLSINHKIIKRGKNADLWSIYHKSTQRQQEKLQIDMQEIYKDFVQKVADGRNLSVDRVDQVSRGRIWSGRQALDNGLVDQLGCEADAILAAQQLAGLDPNQTDIQRFSSKTSFFQSWITGGLNMRQNRWQPLLVSMLQNRLWFLTPYQLKTD